MQDRVVEGREERYDEIGENEMSNFNGPFQIYTSLYVHIPKRLLCVGYNM